MNYKRYQRKPVEWDGRRKKVDNIVRKWNWDGQRRRPDQSGLTVDLQWPTKKNKYIFDIQKIVIILFNVRQAIRLELKTTGYRLVVEPRQNVSLKIYVGNYGYGIFDYESFKSIRYRQTLRDVFVTNFVRLYDIPLLVSAEKKYINKQSSCINERIL